MRTSSLRRRYVVLNSLFAGICIGAIGGLFYISNLGFNRLVQISARSLSSLYAISDAKSLLSRELLDWNAYVRKGENFDPFLATARELTESTEQLQRALPASLESNAKSFDKIHDDIVAQAKLAFKEGRVVVSMDSLYRRAYQQLDELNDALLLDTGDQQGGTIRESNFAIKATLSGVLALVFGLIVLASLHFTKTVIGPIMVIAQASRRVASGDLKPIDTIRSQDEIGVLASNFNHMMKEILLRGEAQKVALDSAERANAAKSVFLANMSHELRTPMHGVLSYARFGQQRIETATKEKLKSYFDEIYDSGSRLMSLLNDLLDLSKLEAGKIVYSSKENDLVKLSERVIAGIKSFAEEKGLEIQLSNESPTMAGFFDDQRIGQVLTNLLSNAIKFSHPGGTIRVAIETVGTGVRCIVTNQGLGIPQDELESVFDKFVQSSKTRTQAGGTGLGLAICREIVQQHGGRIWAESDASGETRFAFMLPSQMPSQVAA